MALIDRDEAIKRLEEHKAQGADQGILMRATEDWFIKFLQQCPAVDAEPVVHARWEPSSIGFEEFCCSHCGGACWYYEENGKQLVQSRYCPNCGAKMDGGDSDERS